MSSSTTSGHRLSRDQLTVAAALLGVAALAWLYLILRGDSMVADPMGPMESTTLHAWSASDYVLTWTMWVVMMAAMMLPTIIPLTHMYVAIGTKARRQGSPVPPTAVFVAGYLLVWTAFSLVATTAQFVLDRATLLTDNARTTSLSVAGGLLLATGVYELTPLKRSCLRACRGPADFIVHRWRKGTLGALQLGAHAGMFCLGCCALLMTLLFVGGVMNLLWVAIIATFVLVEKLLPAGELTSRLAGVAMAVGGIGLLVAAAG
jgi:predicted metal-binding membrane protein